MKRRLVVLFTLAIICTAAICTQTASVKDADPTPILGVWRAQMDGLPAITLTITNESGPLQGAIMFYFHKREAVGQPWASTPSSPGPIFNPKFDGQTLTFQVSHRGAHPPSTLHDPPFTFRLKLISPNKAGLVNVSEAALTGESTDVPGLPMDRTDF